MPKLKKKKKSPPSKKFLTFRKIELSCSNIKKFLKFQETKTLKKLLHFRAALLDQAQKIKKSTLKKIPISGSGMFWL